MDDYNFFDDPLFQKDPYSTSFFAGRSTYLQEIKTWALDRATDRRILIVKAPPGYGKTWLMEAAREQLEPRKDLFLIFGTATNLVDEAQIKGWLNELWQRISHHCPKISSPSDGEAIETALARLMKCLQTDPSLLPIFFLDGIDEPSQSEKTSLENRFLIPVLEHPSARLVVSCRHDFGFTNRELRESRRTAIDLPPLPPPEAEEQLQKRPEFQPDYDEELKERVRPYQFNVPFLNTILVRIARHNTENNKKPVLSKEDIRRCWLAAIGKQFIEQVIPAKELEVYVKNLSTHDGWSQEGFAQQYRLTHLEAGRYLDILIHLGAVHQEGPLFRLPAGLKELIQAELRLEREEKL